MADTMVERVTGQTRAADTPLEVHLVMTEATLLRGDGEPAEVVGGGPVPAPLARELVRDNVATTWLRRLYTRPADGALVAMESQRRAFPDLLRRVIVLRDQLCRTSWCAAPVRHADHVIAWAEGGSTSEDNGQGLCEACNYAKQAPGWQARPGPHGAGDLVQTTTPTGHTYPSRPPPLPGYRRPPPRTRLDRSLVEEPFGRSRVEERLGRLLAAA
jgi:hypothetical protein